MIERRTFMALVSDGLLAAPLTADGQPQAQITRTGIIFSGSPATSVAFLDAFRQRLSELGYAEGRNVTIASRYAAAQRTRRE